jgi:hypothetical protein
MIRVVDPKKSSRESHGHQELSRVNKSTPLWLALEGESSNR